MASWGDATPGFTTPTRLTMAALVFACLAMVFWATTVQAEHGDWVLGTCALNDASQAPEGFYYQNLWSYYSNTGSKFVQTGPLKTGPHGNVSLGLNFSGTGRLDLFIDQNISWVMCCPSSGERVRPLTSTMTFSNKSPSAPQARPSGR
jgi:hypothetical protein